MPLVVQVICFFVLFVWLIAVTVLFIRQQAHYHSLTDGTAKKTLTSILEEVLTGQKLTQKDIALLQNRCDTIEKDGVSHIQKIGLLRFNPFKDTGGDQSFIMALLDGKNSGVVISSLYARSGTRWYAKRIVNGLGADHELSDEEKKAIKEAKTIG